MIEPSSDQLVFRFPEIHHDAVCRIEFQRTLRIPDDNRDYPLPPGLGRLPLDQVDDYTDAVPAAWRNRGGVFLPMYQAEAMWINFDGDYPMAVKVAAGKINALNSESWTNELPKEKQDYLVVPGQRWLDGFCVERGLIRQFVAVPLGEGYTAEEQLTEDARHGGIQIVVYPMKASRYEQICRAQQGMMGDMGDDFLSCADGVVRSVEPVADMGLAPGGLMRQEIYDDLYGFEGWENGVRSRCFVHILNSLQFSRVTGAEPPGRPPTAKQYTRAGLPWFEYYDADRTALEGAMKLAGLDGVAAKRLKKGEGVLPGNDPVAPGLVKELGVSRQVVREGEF